ncbi:ACT domain-containing protein [Enterococcus faecalis]|uniref:ACT domain-containing protein n=1 Tax=Enterococcus faecalis TaxID=1351 RepID=UPI001AD6EC52|nr:ACT domain-containing protein [Enterococcus faecalis]MBO6413992.1 ACT domain-containing protein [Enterococcus faecalis]MBO6416905.1 ACT domain-containing protein [Enterococcus faecalis]MBO6432352.1 ACT domain-containing protein [Enterococcus faecalis]MBO6442757.1 ACT domain-containing protein [Enterococcus faecalis]MBO6446498.1 ACT domain-containing protein [Enterococcus faecalis]
MKAILTVVGMDKVGIIAGVSQKLAELNINILDVSQTIMEDYFTMMMMLQMQPEADLEAIKQALSQVENTLSVKISIQNEEIFNAMHKL